MNDDFGGLEALGALMGGMDDISQILANPPRIIANTVTENGAEVDTVGGIPDGSHTFETGICHPDYNDGEWVIVEAYDTEEDARAGHDKWVKVFEKDTLPESLTDCCNSHQALARTWCSLG